MPTIAQNYKNGIWVHSENILGIAVPDVNFYRTGAGLYAWSDGAAASVAAGYAVGNRALEMGAGVTPGAFSNGVGAGTTVTFRTQTAFAASGADGGDVIFQMGTGDGAGRKGSLSVPGTGADSEKFGLGSRATANDAVAVGNAAIATGSNSIAVGSGSAAGPDTGAIAIGDSANVDHTSIGIGINAVTTADFQLVVGSSSSAITDIFFGEGVTDATPADWTLHGTGGTGTDINAGDVTIAGGQGTGTGTGGEIIFQTATPAGGSGAGVNALVTAMTVTDDQYVGIGETAPTNRLTVVDTTMNSQFNISGSAVANTGGYLTSIATHQILASAGSRYDGVAFRATDTTSSIRDSAGGVHAWYTDSGLVVGNTFTPTQRLGITVGGGLEFQNSAAAAVSVAGRAALRVTAGGILQLSNNAGAYAAVATGGSVGPGTTNTMAKFTAADTVGDSGVTDDGSIVTVTTEEFSVPRIAAASFNEAIGAAAGAALAAGAVNNTFLGHQAGNAVVTGDNNTLIGKDAGLLLTGGDNTFTGEAAGNTVVGGARNVIIGQDSDGDADLLDSVVIGTLAVSTFDECIVLGSNAASTAANQFVAGSAGEPVTAVFFGEGVSDATAVAYTIHGTGGLGTDIAGATINIAGGAGTGTGLGGTVVIRGAMAGTTSATPNALADLAIFDPNNGATTFDITQNASTSGSPEIFSITGAVHTTLTASTEAADVAYDLGRVVEFATGALAQQRAVQVLAPTYAFVAGSTISDAATFYIDAAPTAGSNATLTRAMALWVDTGISRLDDGLVMVERAATPFTTAATFGTVWLRSDAPNNLIFTNDAGTDINLSNTTKAVFIGAVSAWPSTTSGCAAVTQVEFGTNDVDLQFLDFDQTSQEFAQVTLIMPDNWDAGTVTFKVVWTSAGGVAAQTVDWELQGRAYANDDPIDAAWGSAVQVVDALIATDDVHESDESAAVTLAGTPAAGEMVQLRINRNAPSDSLAADARFIGIRINYTTTSS